MNSELEARGLAQRGLRLIEDAILKLLSAHPEGLRNSQIAELLGLRSAFRGRQQNYLTYSVLGGLLEDGRVVRDDDSKLFSKAPPSNLPATTVGN